MDVWGGDDSEDRLPINHMGLNRIYIDNLLGVWNRPVYHVA
jgi:hypothetical protein